MKRHVHHLIGAAALALIVSASAQTLTPPPQPPAPPTPPAPPSAPDPFAGDGGTDAFSGEGGTDAFSGDARTDAFSGALGSGPFSGEGAFEFRGPFGGTLTRRENPLDSILVTAELQNADLMEVIQGLFAEHDIQHIMSATAEDQGVGSVRVNVRLEEVPLSEVLDALLGMNGLGYRVVADGVVVIAPLDRLSDWARSHEVQNVFQRGAIEQAHIADTRQLQDQIRLRMEGEMREFQESSAKIEALREQLESGELLDMEEITEQIAQAQVAMRRARAAQRESQRVLRESLRSDFTAPLGWNGENAMVTHVFHLSPERADEMQVVIQPLLSNEGNVIRGPQGVLIVNDREAVIDKVDEVLESIEARIDSASTSGGGERLIYRRTMAEGTESPVPGTQMRLQLIDVGDNGADGVRVVVSTPDVQIEEHIDIETPVILIDHEIRLEDVITSGDTPRAVIAVNQLPSKKVIRSMREGDTLNFRDLSVTMESVRGDDLGPGIDGAVDFTLNFPEGHEGGEEVKLTVAEGHTAEISGYTVAVLDTTPANWRREARADVEISQISDARADAIHIRNARAAERDAERENQ